MIKEEKVCVSIVRTTDTSPKGIKQLKDSQLEIAAKIAKFQTDLFETYLFEYCEVNGVEEVDLKKHLVIGKYPDNRLTIFNVSDKDDIKLDCQYVSEVVPASMEIHQYIKVSGSYLEEKEKYPKTTKFLENNKEK